MSPVTDRSRRSTIRDALVAFGMILGINLIGSSPAFVVGSNTAWIDRPWFYPPEILFPIVWTLLFTLMGISLFLVWRRGKNARAVRLAFGTFFVQLALNVTWTPVFFGLQRPDLGLVVIIVLWVAILGTIVVFDRVDRLAAVLLVPYLGWVSFAIALNYAIVASVG